MSEFFVFAVEKRERAGKGAARAVRRQGLVPGVVYGDKKPPFLFQMDPRPLAVQLGRPGFYTRQYEISAGSETMRVVAQAVQFDVVTDRPIHVDFLRVSKDTELTAHIPVDFVNQAKCPGLKRGGVLNVVHQTLEVVCKPDDMPERLVFDLTTLDIGEALLLSSINLPAGVQVQERGDLTIATIVAPSGLVEAAEAEKKEETSGA